MADDNSVSLRPKARILKTLGDELISSDTVAIIELVKNSYDADAQNVLIDFSEEDGRASITISDDGCGMDLEVIKNSWMTIATPVKKHKKKSDSFARRFLGEKGIGRFSSARLADELELVSRAKGTDLESYVYFDWSQFDEDVFLDEIVFLTEERKPIDIPSKKFLSGVNRQKPESDSGTILKMLGLKSLWEEKDFVELERGLSRLISPFNSISKFNVYLRKPYENELSLSKIEPPEIIQFPHYTIEGNVASNGKFSILFSIEELSEVSKFSGYFYRTREAGDWRVRPLDIEPSEISKEDHRLIGCGALKFNLRIWDRDDLGNVDQKIGGGLRSIRKDLDSIAGINIYRDDFRVLPYGEPNNDWLRLDMRRVQTPAKRLSNNQLTGYISITADNNPQLHDRSNREGLDNNSAYRDLEQIMIEVLAKFENIRYLARRGDKSKKVEPNEKQKGLFDDPSFSKLKSAIGNKAKNTKDTLALVSEVEANWKAQIKNFKEVLSQYHSLATLGGIVDKVLHDGRQPLGSIQTEAGLGKEISEDLQLLKKFDDIEELKTIEASFNKIVSQATILRDVFKRVEPFGGRKKGRPKKYYIEDLIKDNFGLYSRELDSNGIKISLPTTQTLVSLDTTELSEIFTNLITNSIYWLVGVERGNREIHVEVNRLESGGLEIFFSDNGPGVADDIKNNIFSPYVSGRSDGHGLGLCLVGEIVKNYYAGSIELLNSDSGALFRIVMNKRV